MVLILAYGNSLRRDDGAGFVLAGMTERMISEAGFEVDRIDSQQLEPELALDIANEKVSAVLFIDTRTVPETQNEAKMHSSLACPPSALSTQPQLAAPVSGCLRVQFRRLNSAQNTSPCMGHHFNA